MTWSRYAEVDELFDPVFSYWYSRFELPQCKHFPRTPGTLETSTDGKMLTWIDGTMEYFLPPRAYSLDLVNIVGWTHGFAAGVQFYDDDDAELTDYAGSEGWYPEDEID